MADINPCDGTRRVTVKRLAEKYPALKWRVQLSIPSELDATFPDEDRREFFLLTHTEALWSLPAGDEAPSEPPPIKTEPLRVVYGISVRAGPGRNHAVLGSVSAGTVLTFTDELAADPDYTWRRLAEGFEGAPVAWIAARNVKEARDLLVSPLS